MGVMPSVSFKEFVKNPFVAILFMCLLAIGYLYVDNKTTLTSQIDSLQKEVDVLKKDYKELNDKFIETLKNVR